MEHKHEANGHLEACIKACLECMTSCTHHLAHHCLPAGGKHVEAAHVILMLDCAEICALCANFATRGSAQHEAACRLCATVCEACATSCAGQGDMEDCADACRRCAEACGVAAGK